MNITIRDDSTRLANMLSCLQYLRDHQLNIGLPSTAPGDLAFILAVQEHGSPVMRIPPRPVILPALSRDSARQAMSQAAASALSAAARGDLSATQSALASSGQAGADAIRSYIDEGVPPPNAPVTVSGGWVYNRVAAKGVPVPGKGFNKPLYDTGRLYRSFSYEIVRK